MTWPNPNEYVEAIQNPKQAFADYELQNAQVVTNNHGLPRPISGNFATVFEIENGTRKWAVRCFVREVTNQQQRYAAITAHLKKYTLPYMVGFEYLPQGIKVKGKWYPILKMDWINAARLDIYLKTNLTNSQKIHHIAEQWLNLCVSLRKSDIAHGDLQHGNILVTSQDELKLIDYDGMFISDLIGLPSDEIGHRHYQHPTRKSNIEVSQKNYRNVDNFSAYVIGLSLLALSIDAGLWDKTQAGEENLLFKDKDFSDFKNSSTLALLQNHNDERIRRIAQKMQHVTASSSYLDIPAIEVLDTPSQPVKSWIDDHLKKQKPAEVSTNTGYPSWLLDHIESKPIAFMEFSPEFVLQEKQAIEAEFGNFLLKWLRPLLFHQFARSRVFERFSTYPIVSEKEQLQKKLEGLEQNRSQTKSALDNLHPKYANETQILDAEVKRILSDLKKISDDIDNINRRQDNEIKKLGENQLEQYYQNSLRNYRIAPNKIDGIGPVRITAINSAGIYTAADIVPANESKGRSALSKIKNSSPSYEWRKLEQWRDELKQLIPNPNLVVTPYETQKIREKYDELRRDLIKNRDEKKISLSEAERKLSEAQTNHALKLEISKAQRELQTFDWRIKELRAELKRYENITPDHLLELILKN